MKTPRRLGVAEAKAHLSSVLREAVARPTIIHSRGRDLAVVLAIDDYEGRVVSAGRAGGGRAFLEDVEELKRRLGGGVDELAPEPVAFQPRAMPARARR